MAWGDDAKLGSGLPDRFVLTVATSVIDHPYEKNPTQAAAVITGESKVDDDISDEHLWLKAGESFEPGDKDGTFWVHSTQKPDVYDDPASKKKKLNKNSAYGKFLNSALAVGVPLEEVQDPSRSKYEIWDVKFWEGLILDIEMVDEPYSFNGKDGTLVEGSTRQPYVRAYLGKADGTAAPATYIGFLEAYVGAGGSASDEAASKPAWEAARA